MFRCFSLVYDPYFQFATSVIRERYCHSKDVDRDISKGREEESREKERTTKKKHLLTLFKLRKLGRRRQIRSGKLLYLSVDGRSSAKLSSIRYWLIRFQPAAVNCVRNCARGHEEKISCRLLTFAFRRDAARKALSFHAVLTILELSKQRKTAIDHRIISSPRLRLL